MRISLLFSLFVLTLTPYLSAQECTGRYREKVFEKVKLSGTIPFASNPMAGGGLRELNYDFYEPEGDTASQRPLVIIWHGGAFLDLFNKRSPDIVMIAHELVQRGYVVISPDYRGLKSIGSFLKERDVIEEVVRSVIDGNDLVCRVMDDIENKGNPHRINKDEIFAGGVSGGAILGLHLLFLENLDQMPPQYAAWARTVDGGRADIALANKYCTANPIKGFINISGALLDTAWIKKTDVTLIHYHGDKDFIVPYDQDRPLFGLQTLPIINGSKPIHEKAVKEGIQSTFEDYKGRGHVPFLNLNIEDISDLLNIVSGGLVDEAIFYENIGAMVDFLAAQVECEKAVQPTPVFNNSYLALNIYPNPADGQFRVNLGKSAKWNMDIRDISGRLISSDIFTGQQFSKDTRQLNAGMYVVQITPADNSALTGYSGKLIIR